MATGQHKKCLQRVEKTGAIPGHRALDAAWCLLAADPHSKELKRQRKMSKEGLGVVGKLWGKGEEGEWEPLWLRQLSPDTGT